MKKIIFIITLILTLQFIYSKGFEENFDKFLETFFKELEQPVPKKNPNKDKPIITEEPIQTKSEPLKKQLEEFSNTFSKVRNKISSMTVYYRSKFTHYLKSLDDIEQHLLNILDSDKLQKELSKPKWESLRQKLLSLNRELKQLDIQINPEEPNIIDKPMTREQKLQNSTETYSKSTKLAINKLVNILDNEIEKLQKDLVVVINSLPAVIVTQEKSKSNQPQLAAFNDEMFDNIVSTTNPKR